MTVGPVVGLTEILAPEVFSGEYAPGPSELVALTLATIRVSKVKVQEEPVRVLIGIKQYVLATEPPQLVESSVKVEPSLYRISIRYPVISKP